MRKEVKEAIKELYNRTKDVRTTNYRLNRGGNKNDKNNKR